MRIEVDGGGYDSATEALFGGNHSAAIHYNALIGKLGGLGAMAGDDKSSEDFTTNYDAAARDAVGACNDLVDAFAPLGVLTATSIDNHRKANAGSVYDKPPPVYDGSALPRDARCGRAKPVHRIVPGVRPYAGRLMVVHRPVDRRYECRWWVFDCSHAGDRGRCG